jgi:hypothetical protein
VNWAIEQVGTLGHAIGGFIVNVKLPKSSGTFTTLLMSDEHWDNAHADQDRIRRDHKEAVARDALILKFGDTFCAMQGKWDKRSDQNELRPEHRGNNYLDRLVSTAADFYKPYAKHIGLISRGNHETAIAARHQTDLIDRLTGHLRDAGGPTLAAPYAGFVRFRFHWPGTTETVSKDLCYHHGYGGGGEVTRGMIDNNRTRSQYDADVFYSGHIHRVNSDENQIIRMNQQGKLSTHTQVFLRGGAYKEDHHGGWSVGGGRGARPLGGWWLTFKATSGPRAIEIGYQRT